MSVLCIFWSGGAHIIPRNCSRRNSQKISFGERKFVEKWKSQRREFNWIFSIQFPNTNSVITQSIGFLWQINTSLQWDIPNFDRKHRQRHADNEQSIGESTKSATTHGFASSPTRWTNEREKKRRLFIHWNCQWQWLQWSWRAQKRGSLLFSFYLSAINCLCVLNLSVHSVHSVTSKLHIVPIERIRE